MTILEERESAFDVLENWRRAKRDVQRMAAEGRARLEEEEKKKKKKKKRKEKKVIAARREEAMRVPRIGRSQPQQFLTPSSSTMLLARVTQTPLSEVSSATKFSTTTATFPVKNSRLFEEKAAFIEQSTPLQDVGIAEQLLSNKYHHSETSNHWHRLSSPDSTTIAPATVQTSLALPLSRSAKSVSTSKERACILSLESSIETYRI